MARPAWPPPITSTSRAGVADTGVIGPAPGRAGPDSRLRRAESGKGQVLAYATSAWLRVRRYRGPEQRGRNPNPQYHKPSRAVCWPDVEAAQSVWRSIRMLTTARTTPR